MFIDAVVIAGDGPRADVDVTANAGVADVGEMADLGARTDRGLFDFNEVADVGPVRDVRLGSQAGEGSNLGILPRPRVLDDRIGQDSAIGADGAILEEAVGAYADAIAQFYLTLEEAVDVDGDIAPGPQPTPHVDAVGIEEGHPFAHEVLGDAALIASLQVRELQAVVDPQDLFLPVRLAGGDGLAIRHRQGDDIRQVVLALGIVVIQSRQPIVQLGSIGHQEAGVDFLDGEFGLAGVPGFDNRPSPAR